MISNKFIILAAFIALINCIELELDSHWRIRCSDGRVCSGHNTVAITYAECCGAASAASAASISLPSQICNKSPDYVFYSFDELSST